MSKNSERLEKKPGGWLERYVFRLFQLVGFRVERNKRIKTKEGIEHEIDLFIKTPKGVTAIIECKDYSGTIPKSYFDAFIAKRMDLKVDYGIFVISQLKGYEKYKKYLSKYDIRLVDGNELEKYWDELVRSKNREKFSRWLIDRLGLKPKKKGLLARLFGK